MTTRTPPERGKRQPPPGATAGPLVRAQLPVPQGSAASWGLGDGQAIPWQYAPAPESRDVVTIREQYGLFINGREVPARSGETFPDVNPATEEILTRVAKGGPEDVDAAVRSARAAFRRRWGDLPGRERAKYLFRIARLLQERSREFAVLETMDSGKPIKESRDVDIPLAAAHFWYTQAGRTSWSTPSRDASPGHSGSRRRSSRGTSRS